MLKIIFILLIALAVGAALIFAVGLWHFRKQTIYSQGKIYDNTHTIEQSIKDRAVSPAALYFQAVAYELRALQNTLSSQRPFMLLFK